MQVQAIKTRIFEKNESLFDFVIEALPRAREGAILAVTSKILSLSQGRIISKSEVKDKRKLVAQEADRILGDSQYSYHTLKDGILMPAAGIDESNAGDAYILWPMAAFQEAQSLRDRLMNHYGVSRLGIIFTDSRSTFLRRGVTGVGIAHAGFRGLQDHVGRKDLFGRPIAYSASNSVDALAAAAVHVMGEVDEACPIAVIEDSGVEFVDRVNPKELVVEPEGDLFASIMKFEDPTRPD